MEDERLSNQAQSDNPETIAMNLEEPMAEESVLEETPGTEEVVVVEANTCGSDYEQQLVAKDETIQELSEQVKRISAEFENFRVRQNREQARQQDILKESFFRELLTVLDHFEGSLAAASTTNDLDGIVKGISLIERDVRKIFESHGVVKLDSENEAFDPNWHQAVATEERDDIPDQTIIEVFQPGYKIGDRLLRPSVVKVAKN